MIFDTDVNDLLNDASIKDQYNDYLTTHISNVKRGYEWLKDNLPDILAIDNYADEISYYGELDEIIANHDKSKYNKVPDADNYYELTCEYDAYANYFYGEASDENKELFDLAWLSHIHHNPHHWQHWMLQNDEDGLKILDMPYVFIVEMFCDHWSFSWRSGNLMEIEEWYLNHKDGILLSDSTRKTYETILNSVKSKLIELGE